MLTPSLYLLSTYSTCRCKFYKTSATTNLNFHIPYLLYRLFEEQGGFTSVLQFHKYYFYLSIILFFSNYYIFRIIKFLFSSLYKIFKVVLFFENMKLLQIFNFFVVSTILIYNMTNAKLLIYRRSSIQQSPDLIDVALHHHLGGKCEFFYPYKIKYFKTLKSFSSIIFFYFARYIFIFKLKIYNM